MNDFEKIEKLRQHADVTFEEAKEALQAANGDLLDAMIYLEKKGKAKGPAQSVHSTKYEEQKQYSSVEESITKSKNQEQEESLGRKLKNGIKIVWQFLTQNFFVVRRNGQEIAVLPVLILILALIFLPVISIIALIVLVFLGFRYSFRGRTNMQGVNETMDKASDAASNLADKVKDEINNRK